MPRVLVAEDSPTQAEQLRLILESEEFELDLVRDGQQGLDRLRRSQYDLVISDVVMPAVSGYDFCRRMKDDPRTKDIPFILLTTLSDPMDIIQGLECGAGNFITKPYEPDYLVRRLRSVVENRRLHPRTSVAMEAEARRDP